MILQIEPSVRITVFLAQVFNQGKRNLFFQRAEVGIEHQPIVFKVERILQIHHVPGVA
ncbi:hypothetical protein [Planococcus sp. ISL-109]|uniref:hypothetical protein n=1 Tax=Planococcus sp. ISL-109 TaxID=2819166 RepID=UPI001BED3408|nr:hypothetical protein [Planococcus sp. ISL-109]MBT2581210.1 hypothetical protein [Planococcus sp. ISL-109]